MEHNNLTVARYIKHLLDNGIPTPIENSALGSPKRKNKAEDIRELKIETHLCRSAIAEIVEELDRIARKLNP